MGLPKKPGNVDEFIKSAKAELEEKKEEQRKPKKFLIELPYDLWKKLKLMALEEGKPLKDLILEILEKSAK